MTKLGNYVLLVLRTFPLRGKQQEERIKEYNIPLYII